MTNKEAIEELKLLTKYSIDENGTVGSFPMVRRPSQVEALKMAIKALDVMRRIDGFKYATTECILRENAENHFDIYKQGWNNAIQAVIEASDRPILEIFEDLRNNSMEAENE